MADTKRILITCKTYPQPSLSHQEVVCTAGIRDNGQFIRLYPLNFRKQPAEQQFPKYSCISVDAKRNSGDPRPESYRPKPASIKILNHLDTANNWAARKEVIDLVDETSMCELKDLTQQVKSLGLIKVSNIDDFIIEPTSRTWKPEHEALLKQQNLFGDDLKPIEKVPYKFVCKYKCTATDCKGHRQSIIDWEFYELYRRMRNKFQDEKIATKKVKEKFINQIASSDKDLQFFVGTVLKHSSWLIIGTFYPKDDKQGRLF